MEYANLHSLYFFLLRVYNFFIVKIDNWKIYCFIGSWVSVNLYISSLLFLFIIQFLKCGVKLVRRESSLIEAINENMKNWPFMLHTSRDFVELLAYDGNILASIYKILYLKTTGRSHCLMSYNCSRDWVLDAVYWSYLHAISIKNSGCTVYSKRNYWCCRQLWARHYYMFLHTLPIQF